MCARRRCDAPSGLIAVDRQLNGIALGPRTSAESAQLRAGMEMNQIVASSPDDLLAALPHVLGFSAEESVVVLPLSSSLPGARIDIPTTPADRRTVVDTLGSAYARNAGATGGGVLAVVCLTADRPAAEAISRDLADRLNSLGIETPVRLWATDQHWRDLDTGDSGARSPASANRMAAEAAALGRDAPAASREALAESLMGDREPVADLVEDARANAVQRAPGEDHSWAMSRLARFHADGDRLSDPEAARMLVALEAGPTRGALWDDMSRKTSASHVALWSDLTSRAPDEVRTPAASLLAFSHWLQGDGAKAWVALDQIPADAEPTPLANLTAHLLDTAANPRLWDQARGTDIQTEAFVPDHAGQRHPRPIPTHQPDPGRRAPGI